MRALVRRRASFFGISQSFEFVFLVADKDFETLAHAQFDLSLICRASIKLGKRQQMQSFVNDVSMVVISKADLKLKRARRSCREISSCFEISHYLTLVDNSPLEALQQRLRVLNSCIFILKVSKSQASNFEMDFDLAFLKDRIRVGKGRCLNDRRTRQLKRSLDLFLDRIASSIF